MKKIIALFALMLACGYTANAQQKPASATTEAARQSAMEVNAKVEKAAIKDITMLGEFINLTDPQKASFKALFAYKHKELMSQPLSNERKAVLADAIEAKLNASLTPAQVEQLAGNAQLLEKLTH